ncbi:Peptidyl-prolyl cis-trans isomerase FKBP62 [Diplonema papillatum]|nr:Peptidyl-prolyl cis-trans isomerase FKBP62 [Diplonema papillatum]KAJ9459771.1 Peptidyl-prolyl cis-trans isomerase FKBP62 [Diplonema papillatum]
MQSSEEQTQSGEERTQSGEKQPQSGEEQTQSGEERTQSGEKQPQSGEEQTQSGEERTQSGEKQPQSGEEQTQSGEEQTQSGEKQPQSGEEQTQSGEERTQSGEKQPQSGEEQTQGDEDQLYGRTGPESGDGKRFVLKEAAAAAGGGGGEEEDEEVLELGDDDAAGKGGAGKTVTHAVARDDRDYKIVVDLLEKGVANAETPKLEAKVKVEIDRGDGATEEVEGEVGVWEHHLLDAALMRMRTGVRARITVTDRKKRQDTVVVAKLVSVENPPKPYDLTIDEKAAHVAARREDGNAFFRAGDFERAAKKYEAALVYADDRYGLGLQEKEDLKAAAAPALNNLAAIHVMRREYHDAVKRLDVVLKTEPDNTKALLRRAKSLVGVHEYEKAAEDLDRLETLSPSEQLKEEIARVREDLAKSKASSGKQEKQTYAKMFQQPDQTK